jgi:hypothetical protein
MCPVCITTALLSAGGAGSGIGALTLLGRKCRALRRWVAPPWRASRARLSERLRPSGSSGPVWR